jgi:hypothetical protein
MAQRVELEMHSLQSLQHVRPGRQRRRTLTPPGRTMQANSSSSSRPYSSRASLSLSARAQRLDIERIVDGAESPSPGVSAGEALATDLFEQHLLAVAQLFQQRRRRRVVLVLQPWARRASQLTRARSAAVASSLGPSAAEPRASCSLKARARRRSPARSTAACPLGAGVELMVLQRVAQQSR